MVLHCKYLYCVVVFVLCQLFHIESNMPQRTLYYSEFNQSIESNKLSRNDHYVLRRLEEQPSSQPSARPSRRPTAGPSRQPSSRPTKLPSSQPSSHPSSQPSCGPTQFQSRTFDYTGSVQTLDLQGTNWIAVDISGAGGGGFGDNRQGRGARVQTTLSVSGGILQIYVGGQGLVNGGCGSQYYGGGFNGGGNGHGCGSGGGGASDIRVGGTDLSNRIIVAGGGGGTYSGCGQGGHGGQVGTGGVNTAGCSWTQGQGGTASAGGSGGNSASPGSLGFGSAGAPYNDGGGGGGYYGGKLDNRKIVTVLFVF
jgi:hypothetical protein